MTVSNEAVEAAARAWKALDGAPGSWTLEGNMRAVLEAAAPHMTAEHPISNAEALLQARGGDPLAQLPRRIDMGRTTYAAGMKQVVDYIMGMLLAADDTAIVYIEHKRGRGEAP